jgi:predicted nucleic acid-binding protein
MNKNLLDTDILVDYLTSSGAIKHDLLNLMQKGICFTTVLNASELLRACENDEEEKLARNVLDSLKVLGIHSRYALSVRDFAGSTDSLRDALFSVVSSINKLPIVTFAEERYKKTNLKIIHPQKLRE